MIARPLIARPLITRRAALLLALALPAAAQESIGTAEMRPDRTIVLRLVARSPGGARGHGTLEYKPTDPDYAKVLRHLGGLEPGQVKPVPPFPD